MTACPNCRSRIGFSAFARPRFSNSFKCPTCSAELKLRDPFVWGAELAALLISFGVYRAVNGNLRELLLMVPIGIAIMVVQYRFVRIEVVKPGLSG
jgi:hypothetical protein